MNKQNIRLGKVFNKIKTSNGATIRELATIMDVSEMTIRRDLRILAKDNLVKLIHGGAVLNPAASEFDETFDGRYSLIDQDICRKTEKMKIGEKAASLIEADDIIIIDAGTTTKYVAKYIPDNLPLTVLCYTLNALLELHQKNACKIIFAGGYFHKNTQMCESTEGLKLINKVRSTKSFVAAAGVSKDLGVTTPNHYEMETKTAVMSNSLSKILLVDSSKFGKISSTFYAKLSDFDVIITDAGIPVEYEQIIRDEGIILHIV
jgi:DeoR family deoxyribose operon repressor